MVKKLLLIEDDSDARAIITILLERMGYERETVIQCACLGDVPDIPEEDLAFILTDLSLPDSGDVETFERVNQQFPFTPIIVLTGKADLQPAIETIRQGAQDYLVKSTFDQDILAKSIKYAIARKKVANDYARLFQESPTPMYVYEEGSYRFLNVNDAALKQYGYTRQEFLSLTALELRPPEEASNFYAAHEHLESGKYFDAGRWKHKRSDGVEFFVHVYARYTEFEGRQAVLVLAVNIDKEVRTEKELNEKVDEIENILESITDGFFAVDRNWRITHANGTFERITGWKREELIGKEMQAVFPEEQHQRFYQEYQKVVAGNLSVHFDEYDEVHGVWLSVGAYPTSNGFAVFFVDITEQKMMRDKIFADQQNLGAIINNTNDIIWSMDTSYQIISANSAFWQRLEHKTGKPRTSITEDDFKGELLEKWHEHFQRAIDGEAYKVVMQERSAKGVTNYEEISFNPIYGDGNEVVGVSCFSRDITEQRTYLTMIERQNEQLKEIARIQSHEVRSPVATILGLVDLFNMDDPTDPDNLELLQSLKDAANKLDNVIRKITAATGLSQNPKQGDPRCW